MGVANWKLGLSEPDWLQSDRETPAAEVLRHRQDDLVVARTEIDVNRVRAERGDAEEAGIARLERALAVEDRTAVHEQVDGVTVRDDETDALRARGGDDRPREDEVAAAFGAGGGANAGAIARDVDETRALGSHARPRQRRAIRQRVGVHGRRVERLTQLP